VCVCVCTKLKIFPLKDTYTLGPLELEVNGRGPLEQWYCSFKFCPGNIYFRIIQPCIVLCIKRLLDGSMNLSRNSARCLQISFINKSVSEEITENNP
jgi:hypothetical protein